ncbi:mannosyltransferase putative-domain-containing protein [Zopfochytrium polystomum]|nr:mannosyltransferase putative-domain-containing protein [Zopfochytrium polystomum]
MPDHAAGSKSTTLDVYGEHDSHSPTRSPPSRRSYCLFSLLIASGAARPNSIPAMAAAAAATPKTHSNPALRLRRLAVLRCATRSPCRVATAAAVFLAILLFFGTGRQLHIDVSHHHNHQPAAGTTAPRHRPLRPSVNAPIPLHDVDDNVGDGVPPRRLEAEATAAAAVDGSSVTASPPPPPPANVSVDDALRRVLGGGVGGGDRDGNDAGDSDRFVAAERAAWRAWLRTAPPYDPAALGVVPGSRGVVLTGPAKSVPNVIMAVLLLREAGCRLPVQFSYIAGEVDEEDLETVRRFNITTSDFSAAVEGNDWGKEEQRLGGAKVDAILASPFEQVLFLDPDNFVMKDPSYLFDTNTFKHYGALFWPDFPVRRDDNELVVWDIMGLKGKHFNELEFETGQIVVDKQKAWKALMLTKYISQQARYYFTKFLGDKEAFFWGFAATYTPYYLIPTYLHSVGALVDDQHPTGSNQVDHTLPTSTFCGQSMLQTDFYDNPSLGASPLAPPQNQDTPLIRAPPSAPPPASFSPQPLFMHWNMLKYSYTPGIDYFQTAMTYVPPTGARIADYRYVGYRYQGRHGAFQNCLDLSPLFGGVQIKTWNWGELYPNKSDSFHRTWRVAQDAVADGRLQRFRSRLDVSTARAKSVNPAADDTKVDSQGATDDLPPLQNDPRARFNPATARHSTVVSARRPPVRRGVVFFTPQKNIAVVLAAATLLRKTGCALPVYFVHKIDDVNESEKNVLNKHKIKPIPLPAPKRPWDDSGWSLGAGVATALLAAPLDDVLFLDPEIHVLANPSRLFDHPEFARHGALFWPGVRVTTRKMPRPPPLDAAAAVEKLMGLRVDDDSADDGELPAVPPVRFQPGIAVLAMKRVARALEIAEFMSTEAQYYYKVRACGIAWCFSTIKLHFGAILNPGHVYMKLSAPFQHEKYLDGYQDALYYGFLSAGKSFFVNPTHPILIGTSVPDSSPYAPPDAPHVICGKAIVQYGLPRANGVADPLFVELRDLRGKLDGDSADYRRATGPRRATAAETKANSTTTMTALLTGDERSGECLVWEKVPDSPPVEEWDWSTSTPHFAPVLSHVRSTLPDDHAVHRLKRANLLASLPANPSRVASASPRLSWSLWPWPWPALRPATTVTTEASLPAPDVPVSRGAVLPASVANIEAVLRTILLLRESGWSLPVVISCFASCGLSADQVEGLRALDIGLLDVFPHIFSQRPRDGQAWKEYELASAVRVASLLHAPFTQILLLDADADILPLRNPARVFDAPLFRRTGTAFWPDARAVFRSSPLWIKLEKKERPGMHFFQAYYAVDRNVVARALHVAMHMLAEGEFYTNHITTAADALFWALVATDTPYNVAPTPGALLGVAVDQPANSDNNTAPSPEKVQSELRRTPFGAHRSARFCGLAVLHRDDDIRTLQNDLDHRRHRSGAAAAAEAPPPAHPHPLFVALRFLPTSTPDAVSASTDFLRLEMAYARPFTVGGVTAAADTTTTTTTHPVDAWGESMVPALAAEFALPALPAHLPAAACASLRDLPLGVGAGFGVGGGGAGGAVEVLVRDAGETVVGVAAAAERLWRTVGRVADAGRKEL